ncbi:uncharacterized protein LOC133907382 [Phragmites australis]|uniref:uncharacterized protein LOC133907382 n=1 Tax=Phragmites australis TaxID=29695 RepID=UPI002D784BCD|nr:uncharacterized protein LOC133907382 [Phragmites australis]
MTKGEMDTSERVWRSASSFFSSLFPPVCTHTSIDKALTLGNRIVSEGLGWEDYDIEYISLPTGYIEWGTAVLEKHSFNLRGDGKGTDYIYGAIYCSLGKYSVSPSLLKSLLERWNPQTNTFLFRYGERTITLLDMHWVGLSLDGEFYEEFIPPQDELESSLLLYTKCLSHLLTIWADLAAGSNKVSFQQWCDYFHNGLGGPFHPNNSESSRLYTAAFLALWLCGFVVIGGGSCIRPDTLVMASWMALGRWFALAQSALCSLYYSLRLMSTHPAGPSYMKRAWHVQYVIGWMGAYLKGIFGQKMKKPHIPVFKHCARKPTMVNTMFRPANHYSPKESFEFLWRDVNATWYPYNLTKPHNANRPILSSFGVGRIFYLSIRHGMLPWRRCELYIAEPYHPDRVARQFRLDQIIPYPR